MPQAFSIRNTTQGNPSQWTRLPFKALKDEVLGKKYELSLVFVTPKESQILNKKYRHKNKPTNILSFPLDKNSGEIIICPAYAKTETKKFERIFPNYLAFLFIHGLMHLKGFDHGSRMEHEEDKVRRKFGI